MISLLAEARTKAEAFRAAAKEYIPGMYDALRSEDHNISPAVARDRIQKDCINIWSRRTILVALPDEAKDLERQKVGRLGQKKRNSAAFSAASISEYKNEILIDTYGNTVADVIPYNHRIYRDNTDAVKTAFTPASQFCKSNLIEIVLDLNKYGQQILSLIRNTTSTCILKIDKDGKVIDITDGYGGSIAEQASDSESS